jgi:polyisoprenoid-binding protein YceI
MVKTASRLRAKCASPPCLGAGWLGLLCCLCLCGRVTASGPKEIDTARSVLSVRVYRSGLFSALGHDHEVRAPIQKGTFDEQSDSVDLRVDARALRIVDANISEKDRTEIQSTMLGPKVLDSERFPEIRFHASRVEPSPDGKWRLHGELTLHGETRPVIVEAEGQNGHYRGWAQLRQKDFAMTPVTVAGGTVKVKNEVRVEFEIFGKGPN